MSATAALCVVVGALRTCAGASEGTLADSLAAVLDRDAIALDTDSLFWLSEPGVWTPGGAMFTASQGDAPRDVYFARVRATERGHVLDVWDVTNLTRSSSADDGDLTRSDDGRTAIYTSRVRGLFDAVTILRLDGEPEGLTEGWPLRARLQNAVTNLQETGRSQGFGFRRYNLREPSRGLAVEADEGGFVVRTDAGTLRLASGQSEPTEGVELVEFQERTKGMPGTITWVVDTVRNTSFVGPEPIEWLEHRVFSMKDAWDRTRHAVVGHSREAQEQQVAQDLGATAEELRRRFDLSVTVPELGFPPPPVETVYASPLEGEGRWVPVADDPFVATYPGAPTPFFTTYLRPDQERSYARVYMVVWDPRLVQLRMVAGTREPESATGATGPGMAPREPSALRRLIAGFNGGFQALHGEFGMMSDGRVYLPPKPWAATVAVRRDGSVAMGAWTDPPPGVDSYAESWAVEQIPADVVDYRQNLTSVVESGRYNPWGRWWWGAAPLNADEQVRIDRSGLCVTEGGFLIYFWGRSLGPEALGEAMLRARCERGMHLDMNARHTGFEFYNIQPEGFDWPPLEEGALGEGRFEGPVPHGRGFEMRARLLVRSMTPMRFPRYAGRDPRDFFYLTLRPVLPGPTFGEVAYDTSGLPHDGFPYAFAKARLGPAGAGTTLVRMDPTRLSLSPTPTDPASAEGEPDRPLAYLTGSRPEGNRGVYTAIVGVGWVAGAGDLPAGGELWASASPVDQETQRAIGVDGEGFLVYAQRDPADTVALAERLEQAGVDAAVALDDGTRLVFEAESGVYVGLDSYEVVLDESRALPLHSRRAPHTEVLFGDTRPRRYADWARMQDTRVRYFRDDPPTFSRSSGGVRDDRDAGAR